MRIELLQQLGADIRNNGGDRAEAMRLGNSLETVFGSPFFNGNRETETTSLVLRGWDSAKHLDGRL